jgi:Sulfotransferase domain
MWGSPTKGTNLQLIGAGLPRTATTTQMIALEMLGLGPCYHMRNMMADMEASVPLWRRAFDGEGPWDEIFDGFASTTDWPAAFFWRELIDVYPDAKVLLSVRDHESWARSMSDTINNIYFGDSLMRHLSLARYKVDPGWAAWMDLMIDMNWAEGGTFAGTEGEPGPMMEAAARFNDEVKSTVPAERLLVWEPKEGWEPLCEFLEVPVPEEPLPHVNDTEAFREMINGAAIETLQEWWEKQRAPVA